jgi:hypothetical protein
MEWKKVYPKPHPQTAGRVIDGEAVLILADASEINVLNRVGSLIFELSDGTHSVAEIAQEIANQFTEIPYTVAEADTIEFLEELVTQEVMVLEER